MGAPNGLEMSRLASPRILSNAKPNAGLAGIGRRSPQRSGGGSIELLGGSGIREAARSLTSLLGEPLDEIHFYASATEAGQEHRYVSTVLVRVRQWLEHAFQEGDLKSEPRD